jgi:hypothetical protein
MAGWLELEGIAVGQRGDLVAALGAAIRRETSPTPVRMVLR